MAYAATKERAHELIDRLEPEEVPALVELLEKIADPVRRSLVDAPFEDEKISDEENEAAARARAEPGPGTSMEEFLAEMGLTQEDLDGVGQRSLQEQNRGR
jgi:hypothetical protein